MKELIAIVEDEADIAELEERSLTREGFTVRKYETAEAFLKSLALEKPKFRLILLDIMLPGASGTDILKNLKNSPDYSIYQNVPVLFVSAKNSEVDKVLGLELGSDDYIAKPFSPRELAARVKAVLRRYERREESPNDGVIQISGLKIDEKRFLATSDGAPLDLTAAEFKLLMTLARRKTWVFDRGQIIDLLWKGEKYVTDRTVDVHVKHLREKLGKYGYLIKTVRGVGYKLDELKEG